MATTDKKMMTPKMNTRASVKKMNAAAMVAAAAAAAVKGGKKQSNYKKHISSDEDSDDESYVVSDEETESDDDTLYSETDTDTGTDESEIVTDSCSDSDSMEEDENKLAEKQYKQFLSELFPSTYMKEKVEAAKTIEKKYRKPTNKKCPGAPKKKRKNYISDEDEEEDDDEEASQGRSKLKPTNFNISFVLDDSQLRHPSSKHSLYDENDYEDEDETTDEEETTDEDETTDDEEEVGSGEDEDDDVSETLVSPPVKEPTASTIVNEEATLTKMKELFKTLSEEERASSIAKGVLKRFKDEEKSYLKTKEKQSKKHKIKNTQKLKTLLREKDVMNDLKFFNEKMTVQEQESVLEQIELIHKSTYVDKPYRLTLLDSDIPVNYKASAYRKITSLRHMEPGGGEYYKMKNWVDTFMQIPFGKYKTLPITLADGVEKCHEFMDNAKKILDQAVYGLNDAKLQIMQMVGQWIVNPSAIGTAIAIKGPMGTGKTTLVKEGISKILGRDFAFIALGGATDSSFLEGHSYTYEGSTWGKIVDLLIKCKSMNPVIYFDELDKISDTPKGEEIAGILTHLTDTSQNTQFHDRYFSEIEFDLSRCLFIFSYNDESKVNRILLDRMYKIQTKGYDQAQKTTIANNYLMPKICEQVKFTTEDIIIDRATMHYIIDNYTDKEDGVRTLKRCLEMIYTKLNLYRLMRPDTNIFESEMSIKVEFPMTVTTEIVDKLIKKEIDNGSWKNMYM